MTNTTLSYIRTLTLSAAVCAAAFGPSPIEAQETPGNTWKANLELSMVSANGNTRSSTLSSKGLFDRQWKKAGFEIEGGAMSASNREATTAEQFFASEKGNYKLTGKDYLYEKYRWDRNRFAGYEHRHESTVGGGRHLWDTPRNKLTAELGGGYINEERINAPRNEFGSGRAYAKYGFVISPTASFNQDGEYLHNFKDSQDYRSNMETSITAAAGAHLSLKLGFQWKRVNKPPEGFIKDDTLTSAALIINL